MWELDYKESWVPKNWWFWTVVLEKTLESPLDCKEIQPVHPKGDQSWVFIGRTDVKAETSILWLPDVKSWLIWKDPDAGKDWSWEKKGDDRGWEGWIVSLTQWTWVWVNSRSCLWTRRPGMLQSMGSQRVGHDWATELNWTEVPIKLLLLSWVPVHIKFLCVPFENEVWGNGRREQKSKMGRSPASKKYIRIHQNVEQLLQNNFWASAEDPKFQKGKPISLLWARTKDKDIKIDKEFQNGGMCPKEEKELWRRKFPCIRKPPHRQG